MSMLDTDILQSTLGQAFAAVFGAGELIRVVMERQPGGIYLPVEQPPVPIRVQVDTVTEAMRQAAGYSAEDVRLLILQHGLTGPAPTTDDIVVAQGVRWRLSGIGQDPARSYFEMRATRDVSDDDDE